MQLAIILAITLTLLLWISLFIRHRLRGGGGVPGAVQVWLPTALLLALAYVTGMWLPAQFGIALTGIAVFYPDVGWLLILCAGLSVVWAVARLIALLTRRRQV